MSELTNKPPKRSLEVYAAAMLALTLWAGTPIANKLAVGAIDPATAGLLRSALAGLLAAALAWHWRLRPPRSLSQRALLVFSGIASFAVWPMLLSFGLGSTTANHAALIIATIPIFTGLIAAAVDRRRPSLAWFVGVAIALLGTAILIGLRAAGAAQSGASIGGDLVILTGVIACASGYVAGGKLSAGIGTFATTFLGLAIATLVLVPALALLWPRTAWQDVGALAWLAVTYMAVCSSLIGYLAWFWALGHGGIARISAWQLGQPVLTVLLAGFVLAERVTLPLVLAGSAVLLGTALTQLGSSGRGRPAPSELRSASVPGSPSASRARSSPGGP